VTMRSRTLWLIALTVTWQNTGSYSIRSLRSEFAASQNHVGSEDPAWSEFWIRQSGVTDQGPQ